MSDTNPRAFLDGLIGLFYPDAHRLGEFQYVPANGLPAPYDTLLSHHHHMTVTVEAHHGVPVDLVVLEEFIDRSTYARKILLVRRSDQVVVQYGIVRINIDYLDLAVCQEIHRREAPLGRILIEHNVLRDVECLALWQVKVGDDLASHFCLPVGARTYGRTALIHCNQEPAIELLEIVAPSTPTP